MRVCVCVCVEKGKGEGDVRRRTCASFCKLHFPQGYMEGFDDGGREVGLPGCVMGKRCL